MLSVRGAFFVRGRVAFLLLLLLFAKQAGGRINYYFFLLPFLPLALVRFCRSAGSENLEGASVHLQSGKWQEEPRKSPVSCWGLKGVPPCAAVSFGTGLAVNRGALWIGGRTYSGPEFDVQDSGRCGEGSGAAPQLV